MTSLVPGPIRSVSAVAVTVVLLAVGAATARAGETQYTVTELGSLFGSHSHVFDMNDGVVVGLSRREGFYSEPFVWHDGAMTGLPTFGGFVSESGATDLNDDGVISGYSATPAEAADVSITTGATHQTITGWGASNMFLPHVLLGLDEPTLTAAYDALFLDLGANIHGFRCPASFQLTEGGPYNWDMPEMVNLRTILDAALARGNVDHLWLKISSPPAWMKDNGSPTNGGNLLPGHYDDYAQYLVYFVTESETRYGHRFEAVSPFNEPGYVTSYESTSTTPEAFRDWLKVARPIFDAAGLEDVRLMAPEATIRPDPVVGWQHYMDFIIADPVALAAVGCVTIHQYGDEGRRGENTDPWWATLRDTIDPLGLPLWQTEWGILGGAHEDDLADGLKVAWYIWHALTLSDTEAWHYWQYYWDDSAPDNLSGLLTVNADRTDFTLYPNYYCYRHFSANVPPGSIRVEALVDDPDLAIAAFRRPDDTLALIALNRTDHDIDAVFSCDVALTGVVTHVRTSDLGNYVAEPDIAPSGSAFASTVTTRSLSTFIAPLAPACPADLDGSGRVDFGDVLAVLAAWGGIGGPEDLDGSGVVDFGDLLAVLGAWGPCA